MRDGLKVIQLTGAYYGYAVTFVGWVRRVAGDEYELCAGARMALRKSSSEPATLDRLANEGKKHYTLADATLGPEEINRLLVRRCIPADEKVWAKDCPCPADWKVA